MQDRRPSEIRERTHFCSPSLEFAQLPTQKARMPPFWQCRWWATWLHFADPSAYRNLRPFVKGLYVSRHFRLSHTTTLILTVLPKTGASSLMASTPRIMQSVKFVRKLLVVDQCMVMSRNKEKRFS